MSMSVCGRRPPSRCSWSTTFGAERISSWDSGAAFIPRILVSGLREPHSEADLVPADGSPVLGVHGPLQRPAAVPDQAVVDAARQGRSRAPRPGAHAVTAGA